MWRSCISFGRWLLRQFGIFWPVVVAPVLYCRSDAAGWGDLCVRWMIIKETLISTRCTTNFLISSIFNHQRNAKRLKSTNPYPRKFRMPGLDMVPFTSICVNEGYAAVRGPWPLQLNSSGVRTRSRHNINSSWHRTFNITKKRSKTILS